MDLLSIYQCLCDRTRLRMLHALADGPLCVGHLQETLEEPQVKISKHLRYLKDHGIVEAERDGNLVFYSLPRRPGRELRVNLACLQDCVGEDPQFTRDGKRAAKIRAANAQRSRSGIS
ncbi:MAG TPA: metalloregulator ArsR/SmtB family transcription factor [Opitutaceae bacterium]